MTRTKPTPRPTCSRRLAPAGLACGLVVVAAHHALAQSTGDNAVASAEDAFGTSTSHETIGVYDEGNVRGFSPRNAGNFRMEGMYFDIQGALGNRVIDGETIRVGPAAQGYAFPAPTGIVDLALRKADEKASITPFVSIDNFGSVGFELDTQCALAGKALTLASGVGVNDSHYSDGGGSNEFSIGLVPRWHPNRNVEVLAFFNHKQFNNETASTLFVPTGNFAPGGIDRGRYLGPEFARSDSHADTFGTVGDVVMGEWTLRSGLFHSQFGQDVGYSNVVLVDPDLGTQRQIFAYPGYRAASWSGESRLSRRIAEGPRLHLVTVALRGKSVDAHYGGGDSAIVGSGGINDFIDPPRPQFQFGAQTDDQARLATLALGYTLKWQGLGEFTAGLQRSRYNKRVANPGLPLERGESNVWLPSFSAAVPLTGKLALYGSYVRGLEDAGSAPGYATNANQVLPAIRTRQWDAGLRWAPNKDTSVVLGYFEIAKPYIDLDSANRFGVLGSQTHKGVEFSVTGNVTGDLRVVAGGVYLDPTVDAAPTIAQPVGRRPVNQQRLRARFNVNWTLPFARTVTLDAYVNHDSGTYATVDNAVYVHGSTRIGGGLRHTFKLGSHEFTARAELYNWFNAFELVPVGSGVYGYNTRRNFQGWLTTSF
jgi:iron complex outermembrane recepter protein